MDKSLNGPQLARYYPDPLYRLEWEEVAAPAPWKGEFWVVSHKNKVVGELWQGRSGRWFGLIYGKVTIWGPVQYDIALMMVGLIRGPVV